MPRLELTWPGKEQRSQPEPRICQHDAALSYGRTAGNEGDNRLIFGDNLLALKALEAEFTGRVKCVFIDPPYNTGSAFAHYDDGMEHSLWLSLMRDRLELLRRLLAEDGSIWITIDDNEAHYLKVICDEIFGRGNFVANVVWQKRTSPDARLTLGTAHDDVLVYAKNASRLTLHRLPISSKQAKAYKNPDDDPRGIWSSGDFTAQGWRPNQMYRIVTPAGRPFEPPQGRCWANVESQFNKLLADNRIWFGEHGRSRPRVKTFLSEQKGVSAWTWWPKDDVGHNQEAKKESIALFGASAAFETPKPERLIQRVLEIATKPGDLVLDSFAGSGTTGAVAHKMGRRWIMVEMGEHCHTHIIPRLRKVINGEDAGGITEATGWRGGGGFRYFRLSPPLLRQDEHGRAVINAEFDAGMLAQAICQHAGYTFAPSSRVYWQHGRACDSAFIYVSPRPLDGAQLARLSAEVGPERTLLIYCPAYRTTTRFPNLTIKRFPIDLRMTCDWQRDSYALPLAPPAARAAAGG